MIPIEPTTMRIKAWLIRSELTTAPMVVRLFWATIGPSSSSRAVRTSPSGPVVGRSTVPAGATDGEADGLADGATLALAPALADGEDDAPGEPDGDADGRARVGIGVACGACGC